MSKRPDISGAALAGACLAIPVLLLTEAWLLMLVFGAVHGLVAAVPTIGFGTAALLTVGLNMLTTRFRRLFRH
ncbi:hypothetical protein ACFUGD_01345 [Streptomyces sp. NPDC057217]|uniref:hypothetical protein n=1 Tax=Streptomyces sp. NPDC057217 TaxID=3346054 RepID=UPI0036441C68